MPSSWIPPSSVVINHPAGAANNTLDRDRLCGEVLEARRRKQLVKSGFRFCESVFESAFVRSIFQECAHIRDLLLLVHRHAKLNRLRVKLHHVAMHKVETLNASLQWLKAL